MTGYPAPPPHPAGPPGQPPRRPHGADVAVTVVELVVLALAAVVVTLGALLLGGLAEWSDETYDTSTFLAVVIAPMWGAWVVGLVASVVLMARGRLAFWAPLAALAVWGVVVLVIGSATGVVTIS